MHTLIIRNIQIQERAAYQTGTTSSTDISLNPSNFAIMKVRPGSLVASMKTWEQTFMSNELKGLK